LEGERFIWNVSIPVNTAALIYFPTDNPDVVYESGGLATEIDGINLVDFEKGYLKFTAGSGNYLFHVENK